MIKLYCKKGCNHCEEAKIVLNIHGIKYTTIDLLEKDNRAEREYFRSLKIGFVPIIVLDNGKIITDCSVEGIKALIEYGDIK